MSAGSVRTGPPRVPAIEKSGTDGNVTAPRVVTFKGGDSGVAARPCLVHNNTGNGNAILVKINPTDAIDFGGASDDGAGHFRICDGDTTDVSLGNVLSIERLSFVTTDSGDDLDNVIVVGWTT